MPLVDPERGWWGSQCPARPEGLAHAHDRDCDADAHKGRCCECGLGPSDQARPAGLLPGQVAPPIDVNQRMRDLGMLPERTLGLSDHEKRVLEINVLVPERKRGYR